MPKRKTGKRNLSFWFLVSYFWFSFLQNGQVVIRHLQDNAGHGGGVMAANIVMPRAVPRPPLAVGEQLLANEGEPLGPIASPGRPHRLDRVVVSVEIVDVRATECHAEVAVAVLLPSFPAHEIIEPLFHFLAFIDPGAVEGDDSGGRASKGDRVRPGHHVHVAKAATLIARPEILAALDVLDALVGHFFRD